MAAPESSSSHWRIFGACHLGPHLEDIQALITQSLQLLEEECPDQPSIIRWTEFQLSDLLPEHRPPTIIGGDYTVRRPIPKLGRNDPCHCGSGKKYKKYKKCCCTKDQELLKDASQYAGATRTDLKTKPGLAIAFARPAIASNPDRHFDNEVLLEVIRDARVDLDQEPGGDPAETLFDWIEDRNRLGHNYRMIVHWRQGKALKILDVIPRQGLESWIKRQV